jgi:hypothetical protein
LRWWIEWQNLSWQQTNGQTPEAPMTNEATPPQWDTGQSIIAWAGGVETKAPQWAVM